jgi:transposase-like protein
LSAIGVDVEGRKHILGLVEGASENAAATTALLEDPAARGVKLGRRRLFVIDGSKVVPVRITGESRCSGWDAVIMWSFS